MNVTDVATVVASTSLRGFAETQIYLVIPSASMHAK